MKQRRDLTLLVFAVTFVIACVLWVGFLHVDRCLDLGGAIEAGACVGASYPIPPFLEAAWQFKLLAVVPPMIVAAVVAAISSSLTKGANGDV